MFNKIYLVDLREESATYRHEKGLIFDSSEEFWTMCESMIQQIGVMDESYRNCKHKSKKIKNTSIF